MNDYLEALKRAIKNMHGCEAEHLRTEPVQEVFGGKVVWDGKVEVFAVKGHPKAKECYAWAHVEGKKDEKVRYVAVLALPPVTSPQTAVRAAIASASRIRKN